MANIKSVPLLDVWRANSKVQDELRAAFDRVLKHGKFILGEEVDAFEKACAKYLGVEHAIGVSSGTDALLVALMALDIKPGDEVICPTYTFFASAGSIARAGAKPVFVDSRARCFNCDPADIARKVTNKTKAIMPVHLFGQCADMDPIREVAAAKKIPIIEDCAQAIGAEYKGKRAGSIGTVGCFSFFPSKNLGGFGDGGLVTTNDATLAETIRALRTHGGRKMYDHPKVGGNFRIDALQAALIAVKLPHTDEYAAGRQKNAALYTRLFLEAGVGAPAVDKGSCGKNCPANDKQAKDAPIQLPAACQNRHVYNQYVIQVQGKGMRDKLQGHLKEKGVGTAVYYPRPMHLQGCFAELGHKAGDFPVAEKLAETTLALPIFGELTEDEIRYTVDSVAAFVKENIR